MTHCYGYHRRTRKLHSQPFKRHGSIRMNKYLTTYKKGDYVDIITDGSMHKGMPFKYYHGRTAQVFNVNPRSVGVVVNKIVGSRYIAKRVHIRVEHVKKSNCREAFKKRV